MRLISNYDDSRSLSQEENISLFRDTLSATMNAIAHVITVTRNEGFMVLTGHTEKPDLRGILLMEIQVYERVL